MIQNYEQIPLGKAQDLTQKKFGYLTALYRIKSNRKGTFWLCQCDCGNYVPVSATHLTSNHTTSCGCGRKQEQMKEMVGKQFGKLIVLSYDKTDTKGHTYWNCKCECGTEKVIRKDGLISGAVVSCGCYQKEKASENGKKRALDLTDQRFGRLIALYPTEQRMGNFVVWHCQCDCGNTKDIASRDLISGNTQSCGCLQSEVQKINCKKSLIDLTNKKFGKLKVLSLSERHSKYGQTYWLCQCDCGNQHIVRSSHLTGGQVQSCGCINYSIGEYNIIQILKKHNIEFEKEKIFLDFVYEDTGCHPRYDFYLPKYNRIIEFDGRQHFEESEFTETLENIQKRDQIKNNYAFKNNIQIVRIPYWERDNITLEMILGDTYLIKE